MADKSQDNFLARNRSFMKKTARKQVFKTNYITVLRLQLDSLSLQFYHELLLVRTLKDLLNIAQPRSLQNLENAHFQRTAETPSMLYFARAVSLFCSLTLLFADP